MKKQAGFTLVELMVVIAIMAILSAIVIPNAIAWISTQRFNSAVRDIQSTIESIRLFAVKENSQASISFTDGANSYQTVLWKRGAGWGDGTFSRTQVHDLPHGVTTASTVDFVYNSRGIPQTPNTVTINGVNDLSLDIIVNVTGNSRID